MDDSVAVLTDIHANLPAMQAALARMDELGINRVYCGGDLVGYGPHSPASHQAGQRSAASRTNALASAYVAVNGTPLVPGRSRSHLAGVVSASIA